MQLFADKLIHYYQSLRPPKNLPMDIEVLFPQQDPKVIEVVKLFFKKFYNDNHPRGLMLGINPGRFGAGITGVNFTAPKQLKEECDIDHHLKLSSELSAEFIYQVIHAYGGAKKFYRDWFIGAVCPLGFTVSPNPPESNSGQALRRGKHTPNPSLGGEAAHKSPKGKNINYYDDKELLKSVKPFIVDSMNKQVAIGFKTEKCICIGGEKNFKFLKKLNDEHTWFREIIPLPHPRFILQYRRKQKDKFIHQYLSAMRFAG